MTFGMNKLHKLHLKENYANPNCEHAICDLKLKANCDDSNLFPTFTQACDHTIITRAILHLSINLGTIKFSYVMT